MAPKKKPSGKSVAKNLYKAIISGGGGLTPKRHLLPGKNFNRYGKKTFEGGFEPPKPKPPWIRQCIYIIIKRHQPLVNLVCRSYSYRSSILIQTYLLFYPLTGSRVRPSRPLSEPKETFQEIDPLYCGS